MTPKKPDANDATKLKPWEQEFCARVVEFSGNGTKAYRTVKPDVTEATAGTESWKLLKKPEIAAEVSRLTKASLKAAQASADEVIREMSRVGMSRLSAYVWADGELDSKGKATEPGKLKPLHEMSKEAIAALQSIKKKPDGTIEITLWDKNTALTNLGKFHKLLTDKLEVSGKVSLAEKLKAARKRVGR